MKFIHTSDWHIGQIFNEYDRTEEHLAFFDRLVSIVSVEKPDALLVCGDIYHNSLPTAHSQKMFTDAILRLKSACPDMTVVVTAGNHDSGSRLETERNLWAHIGVKVIGGLAKTDGQVDMERHIVEITACGSNTDGENCVSDKGPDNEGDADGNRKVSGYVIALPHIYRQNYPQTDGNDRQKAFYEALQQAVKDRNKDNLPVVMMAHLAVTGCDITGHEEPVGGMEYTSIETFGNGYDYLALGHIHHPQNIKMTDSVRTDSPADMEIPAEICAKAPVARYSGSPIPVSFDEVYPHSVSVVEISPDDKTVKIKELEIPAKIPVMTLPPRPLPFDKALKELKAFPDDKEAYIRLNVLVTDFLPQNAAIGAVKAVEGKKCRYCYIKTTRNAANIDGKAVMTVDEIRSVSPLDVAQMHYRQVFAAEMDNDLKEMFSKVLEEVEK